MAIRAAAAAGVNITYKILYNDAVAMTGGQPVEGGFSVAQIARQVLAEGARRVVVVAEEPDSTAAVLASGVDIRDRDELDAVQRELREIPGLTALIYDQTCAAENADDESAGFIPTRRSGCSSMMRCAKAAATARTNPTASRLCRSRPNSAASAGSTSRTATRISPASRASVRAS